MIKERLKTALSVLALWFAVTGKVVAVNTDVVNNYSSCLLVDNGNGTSTASVTISYKEAAGRFINSHNLKFLSRAVVFYIYNSKGELIENYNSYPSTFVFLGGVAYSRAYNQGFRIGYINNWASIKPWSEQGPFNTQASVTFPNKFLLEWPAVTIQAANFSFQSQIQPAMWGYVYEQRGGVYFAVGDNGLGCKIITNPDQALPQNITITVTAPDWDLGEIKLGEQRIPLTRPADRFCLKYNSAAVSGKPFIVTASAGNSEVNGWYQLKKVADNSAGQKERAATAAIPYQLVLSNVNDPTNMAKGVKLPNNAQTSLPLDSGTETCFVPEFTTRAPGNISAGNYLDQLTFNIVTKT